MTVCGILLAFAASPAQAQSCTFSISNISFGNIDVTLNTPYTATATFTANCTGLNNRRVRICPNIGSGTGDPVAYDPRKLANGATRLSYNLFSDSGYSTIWGSNLWPFPPTPPELVLRLPPAGSGTVSATIYAQIPAGQQTLPALTYTSSFAGGHTAISYAYTAVGNCSAIGAMNAVQVPFTVSATNVAACRVTAADLDFGTVANLTSNVDQSGSASITCTNQSTYRVLLDDGLTGTGPTDRRMTLGANDVTYGLYRDAARTLAWGDTSGVNSLAGTGTGTAQTVPIHGRVPPQTMPSPGTYSDTIVMTVEY
ncbi:MAG: spore coat U domain-containing protein [Hyphomicrobiaceae bacterium]